MDDETRSHWFFETALTPTRFVFRRLYETVFDWFMGRYPDRETALKAWLVFAGITVCAIRYGKLFFLLVQTEQEVILLGALSWVLPIITGVAFWGIGLTIAHFYENLSLNLPISPTLVFVVVGLMTAFYTLAIPISAGRWLLDPSIQVDEFADIGISLVWVAAMLAATDDGTREVEAHSFAGAGA